MSLALSPIEEAKSKTSVVNTAKSGKPFPPVLFHLIGYPSYLGPPDESDEKGSHDQPNTPNEQGELLW